MGKEIERKFLVKNRSFESMAGMKRPDKSNPDTG